MSVESDHQNIEYWRKSDIGQQFLVIFEIKLSNYSKLATAKNNFAPSVFPSQTVWVFRNFLASHAVSTSSANPITFGLWNFTSLTSVLLKHQTHISFENHHHTVQLCKGEHTVYGRNTAIAVYEYVCPFMFSLSSLNIFCSDNNIWLVYLKLNPFEITHARVSFVLFVRVYNYVQLDTRNPASVTRSFSFTFWRLPMGFYFSSNARLMEWCNTIVPQYPSW